MPDLTRYRETDVVLTLGIEIQYWQQLSKLMLVPDSTLQDIADQWNICAVDDDDAAWSALLALLDALVEGTDDPIIDYELSNEDARRLERE